MAIFYADFTGWENRINSQLNSIERYNYNGFSEIAVSVTAVSDMQMQYKFIGLGDNDVLFIETDWMDSGETVKIRDSGVLFWYVRIRELNNSQITPDIVTSCTAEYELSWYVDENGRLTSDRFAPMPDNPLSKPFAKAMWRIEPGVNDGKPFHRFLQLPQKIVYNPVYQPEYITIFDMLTMQDQFETNGLAVLTPISCTITEILNGEWALEIEHAIDPDGKWKYILEKNIIKAMGQLFIIVSVDDSRNENGGIIRATAEHIFYELNDYWLYEGTSICDKYKKADFSSYQVIEEAIRKAHEETDPYPIELFYNFAYSGNVIIPEAVALNRWSELKEGCTPVDIMLGSEGIIALCGGELHRDNFYFSINTEMEGMLKDSFDIHVGYNLKGIERIIDFSQYSGYFRGYSDVGWYAIAWNVGAEWLQFPRKVQRSKTFTYNIEDSMIPEDYTEQDIVDMKWQLLINDVKSYFNSHCKPIISYIVDLEDVKNNPDYKEFINNPRYRVGDSGRVYDQRTNSYVTLRISKTVKDAITGKTLEVTFGDTLSFTRPIGYWTNIVDLKPEIVGGVVQIRDANSDLLFDSNKNRLMQTKE